MEINIWLEERATLQGRSCTSYQLMKIGEIARRPLTYTHLQVHAYIYIASVHFKRLEYAIIFKWLQVCVSNEKINTACQSMFGWETCLRSGCPCWEHQEGFTQRKKMEI